MLSRTGASTITAKRLFQAEAISATDYIEAQRNLPKFHFMGLAGSMEEGMDNKSKKLP